ncbi:protein mono-ADP-ribosyltransferase PARP10 [Esox lucius]|uniref:Poly [ADP-ribose] polymerase n=1 Tax=Esox lucius TaxID=8010 RepID=A0A3P8ZZ13_ESOLU|nr:protein mono-ADP-ribosyltransferase PARP10 [Esox lucius]
MSIESQEDRTVEVLGVIDEVEDELLSLYFENKRRSGGGCLESVNRKGSRALLLFEKAEDAARVLSRRPHVLHTAELTVRKPACKDPCRLLLCGVNPSTSQELVELYVENMMGIDEEQYTLYPSSGRDLVLVHFHQAFNKDFQKLSTKISNKSLDGAHIVLEQIDQTDSVTVENLPPSITADTLSLYLENKRSGQIKEVTMMTEGLARVSFQDFDSVERVINQTHKLRETELTIRPYFSFLQSEESSFSPQTSPLTSVNGTSDGDTVDTQHEDSVSPAQTGSLPAASTSDDSPPLLQSDPEPQSHQLPPLVSKAAEAQGGVQDLKSRPELLSRRISVPDPVNLALFQLSPLPQSLQQTYPAFSIQIRDEGICVSGPDQQGLEQLENTVLEFLGDVAQVHIPFDPEKARFLAKQEVKDRVLQTLRDGGLPCVYSVSDCMVMLASLSFSLVSEACSTLKDLLRDFSIPVDGEYECVLYSQEWNDFLPSLGLCTAQVSERGGQINVLTLRGLEDEKKSKMVKFLSTPIKKEAVITMKSGMLKYIQTHHHQLLADMHYVSIVPLETPDMCGLRIHGSPGPCQMAEQVLQDVVSSTVTRTITVNKPGVARFLLEEGEGASILREMQARFQVYIDMVEVHWKPLETEDIFEAAWKMMLNHNFPRRSSDVFLQSSPDLAHADQNSNNLSAPDSGLLEEAKKLFSAIDEPVDSGLSGPTTPTDMEEEDLCTAQEPMALSADIWVEEKTPMLTEGGGHDATALGASTLDEVAELSLAIQYSMESTKSFATEEEELQKALEMSMKITEHDGSNDVDIASLPAAGARHDKSAHESLQDDIQSANTATIYVFAGYNSDLIRVDIALSKKVNLRQHVEKLEHRSLRSISEYHRKCLNLIKRKHAVDVTIQGTTATVTGFKDFVTGAMSDMKLLLRRIATVTSDSDVLSTVQWVWHDPAASGTTTPYPPEVIVFMENACKMKQKKMDILLNNQPHIINFEKMQEYNVASGKSVTISRKMLSSGDLQDRDYSLSNLPETFRLNEDSDEFQDVKKDFYASIQEYHNKIRIVKVEKLMNGLLYNQYKLKKASMNQCVNGPDVERTLYHGTSENSVKEICVHGFNRSFCGKNATVYGQGVYFAVNSALSIQDQYSPPNADGHKFVFVAKVLTGDFTNGRHSMKTAPLKETSEIPLRYDSVADKTGNPSLFVIFNDTQAYPEYLITCQKIPR